MGVQTQRDDGSGTGVNNPDLKGRGFRLDRL